MNKHVCLALLLTSLGCLLNPLAQADIYVRHEDGVPVFSDRPDNRDFALFLRTSDLPLDTPARQSDTRLMRQRMREYTPMIEQVARAHALEPALLHAVVMVESGYNPQALSNKGAVGLMQLMPETAKRYGTHNRHDPMQNLNGGAGYLAELLRMFRGDLSLAIAAYNAGENAVRRHGDNIPPYAETRRYVPAVLSRYRLLRDKLAL